MSVQMSRSLCRSAALCRVLVLRVCNNCNYFRFSTRCPSPGSTGWSGCPPRRPTCTSRTPAQRSTGASWKRSGLRSQQVQSLSPFLFQFCPCHSRLLSTISFKSRVTCDRGNSNVKQMILVLAEIIFGWEAV